MEVTFISNSRVLGYRPGQIITAELTPQLRALLARGRHLTLIEPVNIEEPEEVPEIVVEVVEEEEPAPKKTTRRKKTVEDDDEVVPERLPFSFPDNN